MEVEGSWSVLPAALAFARSMWPRDRDGSIISRTRAFSCFTSGNPPSVFRSQRIDSLAVKSAAEAWRIVTVKTPPVLGMRHTSPRVVEKVERSSWAN